MKKQRTKAGIKHDACPRPQIMGLDFPRVPVLNTTMRPLLRSFYLYSTVHHRRGRETELPVMTPRDRPSQQPLSSYIATTYHCYYGSMLTVENIKYGTGTVPIIL